MVAATAPVDALPLVASDPLQPADAVHALALLVLQVRVEVPPAATVDGVAPSVTLGASDGGGEVLLDPEPEPEEQAASTRLAFPLRCMSSSGPQIARVAKSQAAESIPLGLILPLRPGGQFGGGLALHGRVIVFKRQSHSSLIS